MMLHSSRPEAQAFITQILSFVFLSPFSLCTPVSCRSDLHHNLASTYAHSIASVPTVIHLPIYSFIQQIFLEWVFYFISSSCNNLLFCTPNIISVRQRNFLISVRVIILNCKCCPVIFPLKYLPWLFMILNHGFHILGLGGKGFRKL